MKELRNITKEAIALAERDLSSFRPELADKEYRTRLSPLEKEIIFMDLVANAEFYTDVLISQIRN